MDEKRAHILNLPDEILLKISERVVCVKMEGKAEYPVDVGYFRLRHVCRRFRAVVREKPHINPLRETHEREYIWPLIEQIHAYDEKWVETRKQLRAQWVAKREAARKEKLQKKQDESKISSHSDSPLISGLAPVQGGLRFKGHRRRCQRCLEEGHWPKECRNPPRAKFFSCCGFWGQHRINCHARHCYIPESPVPPRSSSQPQATEP
jgi:hypothetical protein